MSSDFIKIPPERLSEDILRAVIEEYITREGTDYGHREFTLEQKVEQVRGQLVRGRAILVFDPSTETCTLVVKD